MSKAFQNGFLIFDKRWIYENKFFMSLSHAEFRIMVYLLSSVLRVSKKNRGYKNGELIAQLYQNSQLLVVNVSYAKIAEKCKVNRATVYRALRKFNEVGAVIKISGKKEKDTNNFYILGIEDKQDEDKIPYYFVESIPISSGERMPDDIKVFICENYMDRKNLLNTELDGYGKRLAPILFRKKT